jgi:hypothetical protein
MNNDFDSALWAERHAATSDGIARLFDKLAYVFQRLVAIEYDAPWQRERR